MTQPDKQQLPQYIKTWGKVNLLALPLFLPSIGALLYNNSNPEVTHDVHAIGFMAALITAAVLGGSELIRGIQRFEATHDDTSNVIPVYPPSSEDTKSSLRDDTHQNRLSRRFTSDY